MFGEERKRCARDSNLTSLPLVRERRKFQNEGGGKNVDSIGAGTLGINFSLAENNFFTLFKYLFVGVLKKYVGELKALEYFCKTYIGSRNRFCPPVDTVHSSTMCFRCSMHLDVAEVICDSRLAENRRHVNCSLMKSVGLALQWSEAHFSTNSQTEKNI